MPVYYRATTSSTLFMTMSNMTETSGGANAIEDDKEDVKLKQSNLKKKMPHHDDGGPVQPIYSNSEFINAIENAPENSLVVVQ